MDLKIENWDDLRVFLEAARSGSVSAAARALGVDRTTVTRRIDAFEASTGRKLFDRLRGGVVLSPDGHALLEGAERVESMVKGIELEAAGREAAVRGVVRIAITELFTFAWGSALLTLSQTHPELQVELVSGDVISNLSRREADVAARVTEEPPGHLVGRRFAPIAIALYGEKQLVARHDITDIPWIGWTGYADNEGSAGRVRSELGATGPFAIRVNTYGVLMEMLRRGAGVTLLPCALGESDPALARIGEPELGAPIWVLTHPDLQHTPRIRVVLDALAELAASTANPFT